MKLPKYKAHHEKWRQNGEIGVRAGRQTVLSFKRKNG